MTYRDKKRDVPPTIDDPAVAEMAERFMRGEVPVTDHRGRRRVWSSEPLTGLKRAATKGAAHRRGRGKG